MYKKPFECKVIFDSKRPWSLRVGLWYVSGLLSSKSLIEIYGISSWLFFEQMIQLSASSSNAIKISAVLSFDIMEYVAPVKALNGLFSLLSSFKTMLVSASALKAKLRLITEHSIVATKTNNIQKTQLTSVVKSFLLLTFSISVSSLDL